MFLLIAAVSAIPGQEKYVAPSPNNSTRLLRETSEDALAEKQGSEEDVGPLGEVQLDVEEEDIGDAAQPKMRVRRGYSQGGGQKKSKYGGGQSGGE